MIQVSPPARNRFVSLPQVSPPGSPSLRDGVELPQLLAGGGVVGADEALLLDVLLAAAHALDDLAARDERSARAAAAVGHRHVPGHLAVARVERHEMCVAHRDEQLVVVERHAAHGGVAAEPMLPDQIAGLAVERLDDAAGVVQIDDAVVRERRRLVGAAFGHRRRPTPAAGPARCRA